VNPNAESTDLAHGTINGAGELSVQLISPDGMPSAVRITWPLKPSMIDPRRFPEVAATLARLFATATTELARIKARRG
jgi:hypothetical protein